MDPLSITASAITILQVSGAVINACYAYRCRVKHASTDASRIVNELNSLRAAIDDLFQFVESEAAEKNQIHSSALKKLAKPDGPLATCEAQLKDLEKKLEPKEGWKAARAALLWPLKEGDVRRLLEDIDRTKSTVQLALASDQR
jgi:hypothetical protein